MSYFGVSTRNGVGLGLGTVPSLTNTPLGYRLAPSLDLSFAGSDALSPAITFSRTTNATLTNSAGLVANAPMNLLTFSEQFDNAAWLLSNATVSANQTAAPDGTTTADKLVEAATTSAHEFARNPASGPLSFTAGVTYAYSFYVKAAGRTQINIQADIGASTFPASANALYDFSGAGVVVSQGASATASISSVGNGWFRCVFVATATATISSRPGYYVGLAVSGSASYTGNGTSGIYIWGAQLELGSTATTYNPTTVKNLLGYTEHFDNAAWTKSNATISATKVDDIYGQPFAQKLVEDTVNGVHRFFNNAAVVVSSVGPSAYTLYAKAGERTAVRFTDNDLQGADFDLLTGAVSNIGSGVTAATTSVGNGWWRLFIARTSSTGSGRLVLNLLSGGTTSYTGDGTSGIYIFGAQLSDSASVDPYVYNPVAAPSSVAYYGPRFDYDPVTLAPKGLLIEEQRTNLVLQSDAFNGVSWTKQNITVTANTAVSPDGTINSDTLTETAATAEHYTNQQIAKAASNITYTYSAYFKNESGTRNLGLGITDGASGGYGAIFSTAGSVVSASFAIGGTAGWTFVSSSIASVGNGWFRASLTVTSNTATRLDGVCYLMSGAATNYAGNGTSGVYLWGAQLEAGAFATSYIPTVASQVTRAADSASMIGNNFARWYNQTEGTVFAQYSANGLNPGASNAAYGISDNTTANFIAGRTLSSVATNFQVRTGGADQVALNSTSVAAGAVAKSAGAYALNDFAFSTNAGTVQTDTAGTLPVVTQMQIGGLTSSVNPLNGTISRIAYYPRRLANTELQGITS